MYDRLTGGVHLRAGGVWERCGRQTPGVLEAAETTGTKQNGAKYFGTEFANSY